MTKVNVRRGVRLIKPKPTTASMFGKNFAINIQVNAKFDPQAYTAAIRQAMQGTVAIKGTSGTVFGQIVSNTRTNGKNYMGWDDGETTEESTAPEGLAEDGQREPGDVRVQEEPERSEPGD